MTHLPRLIVLLLAVFPAPVARAELTLAPPFGDHMVLQRETDAPIWGRSDPGALVAIQPSWVTEPVTTRADTDGRWRATLQTPAAGGPHTISIRDRHGETIELTDVLTGEVWVCSGQSNMAWPMVAIVDSAAEIATANLPSIRLFDVPNQIAMEPQETCGGTWRVCSPASVKRFSAVGFLFGRELHAELNVPIGLVSTNWGGTVAEAWTSAGTLRREFPEFAAALDRIDRAATNPDGEDTLTARQAKWWQRFERTDPGMSGRWMEPSLVATDAWKAVELPGQWQAIGLGGFDGTVWYRREITMPESWSGRDAALALGPIDDMDMTWFNGVLVGSARTDGQWNTPRRYAVPGSAVRAGTNVIVVCAIDTGGAGRVGADPAEMQLMSDGETPIALAGAWQHAVGAGLSELGGWPRTGWFNQNSPTALSNGMVAPLIPYAIRGAIWYQGESNRGRAEQYRRLFPAMITDWRARWNRREFPFYWVQIAPFAYGGDRGEAAELREAQALTLSLPNTGMAVTMDIGNPQDIHPLNKQDVAHRLARLALARTYGRTDLESNSPVCTRHEVEGDVIRLSFEHADGLTARGADPGPFLIAGADRVFHEARAVIDGTTILVRSAAVPEPVAVRYGWGAADVGRVWNGAGLPASSFRTDDWPAASRSR